MAERLLIRGNFSAIAHELLAVLQKLFPNRLPSDVIGPGSVKTGEGHMQAALKGYRFWMWIPTDWGPFSV